MSYEPILNVYQTLLTYNGSSAASYDPTLATCVPGTAQCMADYGSTLTDGTTHWTFVIDKTAQFYDPSTLHHWGVYPSDVVFSLARTEAFADLPGVGYQNGWIQSQSLLPFGSGTWDSGIHFPWNNTPQHTLNTMLVNDSVYCPAVAIAHDHGCITFVSNGSGSGWPNFLQFAADNLGASVEPCGWFAYESAGLPGFHSTKSHGNGPCLLPGGVNNTNGANFTTELTAEGPYAWDAVDNLSFHRPAIQPGVQFAMVGSGPYYGGVVQGIGYSLAQNPYYVQPEACSGAVGYGQYVGYCDPAPAAFEHNVSVYWKSDDSAGLAAYGANTTDFAGILTTHATNMLTLAAHGNIKLWEEPTISSFFLPLNLFWSESAYTACAVCSGTGGNVPSNFLTNLSVRQFLVYAYPYDTIENTAWTSNGIQFLFKSGGPIPFGMGNYYPGNVSFPSHNPDTNPSDVGSPAWWFLVGTNRAYDVIHGDLRYYDPTFAACLNVTCSFQIAGEQGNPGLDTAITDWIGEVKTLSNNSIQLTTTDYSFPDLIQYGDAFPSAFAVYNLGWAPDYPDPTDYVPVLDGHDNVYTGASQLSEQVELSNTTANRTSCGHFSGSFADLVYWANLATPLSDNCQGIAYDVANVWSNVAAALPDSPARVLDYNLVEHVFNQMGLYVWYGQATSVDTSASWIDPNSVNSNVMIGGGGDNIYFQVRYAGFQSPVTFKEVGLSVGANWSVTAGSPPSLAQNTVGIHGGSVSYSEPNGTLSFTVTPPSGFGLALVTGPTTTTYGTTTVTGTPRTITLHFGALEHVYFNETTSLAWPGLPGGSNWSVTLTPANAREPAGQSASTTGTSIGFILPKGAAYHFQVTRNPNYSVAPGHGGLAVPPHTLVKAIKFRPAAVIEKFHETGLPAGKTWYVNITGPMNVSLSGTAAILTTKLINGTYTVTASNYTALHPHWGVGHASFMLVVSYPGPAVTSTVTYTGSPGFAGFQPAELVHSSLAPSFSIAAVVSGSRETV